MDRKILFFIGIIVLITQYAHCAAVGEYQDDDDEYLQDKENSDYDDAEFENESDKFSTISAISSSDPIEHYIKHEYVAKGDIGKSVELACKGDFDEKAVVMWYNGSKIISSGAQVFDPRLKYSKKTSALTIEKLTGYDDGQYKCRAFPEKVKERYETNIQLEINGPPYSIKIGHNILQQENVNNQTLIYKAGMKDLRFKCNVGSSRPHPKIVWNRNGNSIIEAKDHDIQIDDALITIKVLHAHHAGEYICEASNEFGVIESKFSLNVEYAPFFHKVNSDFFNTEIGYDAEVSCMFKAFPKFQSVKWFKGTTQLHEGEKYVMSNDMKNRHDRAVLLIKNVEKSDLDVYRCEVQNSLGLKKHNVTLNVTPAPPKFEGFKHVNNVLFTDWTVASQQELTGLQLLYRNNENGWKSIDAKITNADRAAETNVWKIQGSASLEDGEWEIKARVKNVEGWSDDSQSTTVKLPKEAIESSEQTSSASSLLPSVLGLIAVLVSRYFA